MAITKKLQSRVRLAPQVEAEIVEEKHERVAKSSSDTKPVDGPRLKRFCQFCTQKFLPQYSDASALRRFMSDRGRINPRTRTGVCAKHQRVLSRQIKYARHLSLLPFTVRV